MAADRVRDSSSSIAFDPRYQQQQEAQVRPTTTTAQNKLQPQTSTLDQSAFDVGPASYADVRTSGTFDSGAVNGADPSNGTGIVPPDQMGQMTEAPVMDRGAQLDALKTQLSLAEKKEFLAQFGVKEKHLKKAKPGEVDKAFAQVLDQLKEPGSSKFKFKVGGKKYEAKINLDAQTGELDIKFKEKKGFFGKLWDGVKKVGKIALTVAQFIPGPIGIVARVANAVISSVSAFKNGNILGGIAGLAGGIAGGAGALAGKAVSGTMKTIATVAGAVEKGAKAAQGVADAIKNKNWGGVLTSIASGASGVAGALGKSAEGFKNTLNGVAEWATRGNTALQAAVAAKNGDIVGMLSNASELATGIAPNSRAASTFQRLAATAGTAQNAYNAARQGDILGAIGAGADFASQNVKAGSKEQRVLADVAGYTNVVNNAQAAVRKGDYFGAAEAVTEFAAGKVKDPKTKLNLTRATDVLNTAGGVQGLLQKGDYLGAAAAATELTGRLTGADEVQDAAKLMGAAGALRTAVNGGNPAKILEAAKKLGEVIKDVANINTSKLEAMVKQVEDAQKKLLAAGAR